MTDDTLAVTVRCTECGEQYAVRPEQCAVCGAVADVFFEEVPDGE